jgi:hypothetical protein
MRLLKLGLVDRLKKPIILDVFYEFLILFLMAIRNLFQDI